jgi:hypothetical protein
MAKSVAIGRIVLYKTREGDRPMIVVKVWSPETVNGQIFLDGYNDSHLVTGGMKEGVMKVWVTSVAHGNEVGQWRFQDE